MYDAIVIGGGPAALAAAFYAQGKGIDVLILFEELGGKVGLLQSLTGPLPDPYLPGNELVKLLADRITKGSVPAISERVVRITGEEPGFQLATQEHGVVSAKTVIVATGTTPVKLDVPGAEHYVERGLSYSAATYAHLAANQAVAVIGATPRAVLGAAELARTAERVYLIAPTAIADVDELVTALRRQPNVEVLDGYEVLQVAGDDKVRELHVARGGHSRSIPADYAFVSLGLEPNSGIVRDLVALDPKGFIVVDANGRTDRAGLFAAGDVTTLAGEQVLMAIGDGARAAMSAYHYLLAQSLAVRSVAVNDDARSTAERETAAALTAAGKAG